MSLGRGSAMLTVMISSRYNRRSCGLAYAMSIAVSAAMVTGGAFLLLDLRGSSYATGGAGVRVLRSGGGGAGTGETLNMLKETYRGRPISTARRAQLLHGEVGQW